MEAIQRLMEFNFTGWIVGAFLVLAAIIAGHDIISKFSSIIGKPIGVKKQRDEDHKKLSELQSHHEEDMEEVKKLISAVHDEVMAFTSQFSDNRVHDREQSFQIQKDLVDGQTVLANQVASISSKIDSLKADTDNRFYASEEKENKRVQAEIKDKIAQQYRVYHSTQKITEMELEALEDLIATYESHDGTNSFVHSVVQIEMYTWEVIENK